MGAVVGRVTVTAGSPVVLPPPGPPVAMPQSNARGHLNAQLRWGVPDPLRRLSLLQHGYNVWRVREDYAKPRGWNVNPPTPDALNTSARQTTAVRRINRLPLMTTKVFSTAEAANVLPPTGDTNTIFVVDDNDRGRSNIVTSLDFTNGAHFYYFVTARDVLGRDGGVSPGTEVQICDLAAAGCVARCRCAERLHLADHLEPPSIARGLAAGAQPALDEERIRAYWVYRRTNVTELRAKQANPSNNLIAVVAHLPGASTNSYLDAGPGAPSSKDDRGKTFWYTVRAEDSGGVSRKSFATQRAGVWNSPGSRGAGGARGNGDQRLSGSAGGFPDSSDQWQSQQPDGRRLLSVLHRRRAGGSPVEWMELSAEVRPVVRRMSRPVTVRIDCISTRCCRVVPQLLL
jgi:hypothetical protein